MESRGKQNPVTLLISSKVGKVVNKKGLTEEQIIQALEAKAGFISEAAKALNVTYEAIRKRVAKNKRLQQAFDQIKERKLDFAESKLMKQIEEGNLGAICFFLKCQGKRRGWVERQEMSGPEGRPIDLRFKKSPKDMTDDELESVVRSILEKISAEVKPVSLIQNRAEI
ncbi:MAG: hypothetical protein A2Y97_10150 [Nitrospirae bacterium RBG_13_39_12]|nr:MAG: hypothetical protein A2Y97_10150 [Nitrospirae bacterium RBG_13_39_12]